MPDIIILSKEISELIAAGEVVERPASVIKELTENSIDAGATAVTVEIMHGGITYMRVTDNGCGIKNDQVRTAFLRHATSKIKEADDLDRIATLGFRGEALASICAVARVELLTAAVEELSGTRYVIEGGIETGFFEAGCPKGTTIVIKDLFYNTPARMKFLKKDVSEANTVAAILDRISLSHPEVAIKFIRDGKQVLSTTGDGKLISTVYTVLGRDFSSNLISVAHSFGGLTVNGYTCRPEGCRPNRNGQYFFLNGRYIRSGTISAAVEQAYKNSSMIGKFPACVLNLTVPPETVDINVHPTKTEVRFSDERRVFDCVYQGIKNSLFAGDKHPEIALPHTKPTTIFANTEYNQISIATNVEIPQSKPVELKESPISEQKENQVKEKIPSGFRENILAENDDSKTAYHGLFAPFRPEIFAEDIGAAKQSEYLDIIVEKEAVSTDLASPSLVNGSSSSMSDSNVKDQLNFHFVGEAFRTYIVVQNGESLYFVDKHAAHERIIFEQLKRDVAVEQQLLLTPITVTLPKLEYNAMIENLELLEKASFTIDDFGDGSVIVRGVPSLLDGEDIGSLISEIAESLMVSGSPNAEKLESIFHSVSCRSAIKAGNRSTEAELISIAKMVLSSNDFMHCPHGRPTAFELKRRDIEKQFGRTK